LKIFQNKNLKVCFKENKMNIKLVKSVGCLMLVALGMVSLPASATLMVRSAFQDSAVSVDGATNGAASGSLQVDTPVGATVTKAFLYTASTWSGANSGSVTLAGNTFNVGGSEDLGLTQPNVNPANTRVYDVTSTLKPLIEGTNGLQSFSYAEGGNLDGAVLAVIYSHASTVGGTAIILDGELSLAGDTTTLTFDAPYTGGDVFMSVASSFSYNGSGSGTSATPQGQVTVIDVTTDSTSSRRLSSCAGGNDDGNFVAADGQLITVGGVGDNAANPHPNCTGGAGDDEFYNLGEGNEVDATAFLQNGDTFVSLETVNPSNDDNVFFVAFTSTFAIDEVDGDPVDPEDPVDPPTNVPEPASLILFALGLLSLGMVRRIRS
jgi:hypothetical protein